MKVLSKMFKKTVSLLLALSMVFTVMSGMVLSAEETTEESAAEETISIYDNYAWSPLKGVTATAGAAFTETSTATVDNNEDGSVPTDTSKNTVETIDNGDGTSTGYKIVTKVAYTDNGDGTSIATTTVTKSPTVFVNSWEKNSNFKLGVYSDRSGANGGVMYAEKFSAYQIYSDNYGNNFSTAKNTHLNRQHKITVINDGSSLYSQTKNSYYVTETENAAMRNSLIFRAQQKNEMWLEFTAPADGIYTTSGSICKVRTSGITDTDAVKYFFIKIDENGKSHTVSSIQNIPDYSKKSDIPNVNVQLKAGERLVLRTDNDLYYIGKIFVEDYLVTKWDYTTSEEGADVTVNYNYQNQNFMNVYGENYTINSTNFDSALLWNVKAARFDPSTNDLIATADFNKLSSDGAGYNRLYVSDSSFRSEDSANASKGSALTNRADGSIMAKADYRYLTEIENEASVNNYYKYGLQFTFTVPEDGKAVLVGGRNNNTSGVIIERVGIKKAGSDDIVYGVYYDTSGGTKFQSTRGIWNYSYYTSNQMQRTHTIGKVEAGDRIVYEISLDRTTSGTWERLYLDTLAVKLTTTEKAHSYKTNSTDVYTPLEMLGIAGDSTKMTAPQYNSVWKFKTNNNYMNAVSGNETTLTLTEKPIGYSEYVTVASYNVHNFEQSTANYSKAMRAIAQEIKTINPDIIGLQEVDCNTDRSGNIDQVAVLAQMAGYEYYYFGKARDYDENGDYGHAIMSKYPIISSETVQFVNQSGETRSYEHLVIEINGTLVNVYNTHLTLWNVQAEQLAEITASAEAQEYAIIFGDMNSTPTEVSSAINQEKMISLNGGETYTSPKNTFPAGVNPTKPIDDIIVSRSFKYYWESENDNGIIVNVSDNSDHNMIYTYLAVSDTETDVKEVSSYTVNHGATDVTLSSDGTKGDSGIKRSISYKFADENDKMALGFTVRDGENGIYEISAPISVIGDGKVAYSVIKETSDGVRSYLQTERSYEKQSGLLDGYFCELLADLDAGDTVWFEACTDKAGTTVNIGIPRISKIKGYFDIDGRQTISYNTIDHLEYVSTDYEDTQNDIGYAYSKDSGSLVSFASAWRSGYFADYVTLADEDPFGISGLTSGADATEFAKKFSTFDFNTSQGNYFQTSYATAASKGDNAGTLYVDKGNYTAKKISICIGYEETNGGYTAGIFHEFTAPTDGTAAVTYPTDSDLSVLTLVKDGESGKYTVSALDNKELKKGDSVVICYYKLGGKATVTMEAPVITMTSSLGQVSFNKSTDNADNTVTANLLSNGTEITLPTDCDLEKGFFLDSWADDSGNVYEVGSVFTVNGETNFTANTGLYGDADHSGSLAALDLTVMRKYLIGNETEIYEKAADMNTDSGIDLKDLVALKKKLAEIG